MARKTPLYGEHVKLGAKMVEFAGWEMPVIYSGITEEHQTVRNAAGIFDVSHMGIFEFTGAQASDFLNYLTPNNISRLSNHQAQYSLLLTDRGTIVDDIIVYKLSDLRFLMVVNAANLEKDFGWIKKHLNGDVKFRNLSENMGLLAIQGPKAAYVLKKISDVDLDAVEKFHLAEGTVGGVAGVVLARTGYTGEDGFELFTPRDKMATVWRAVLEAGEGEGIKPIGLGARDTLRLEMKFTLYGHEITEETNALEAGLSWVVKLKKPCNFIGREALKKIREEGVERSLVGFKMIDRGIPRGGYRITSGGRETGYVTSGTFSPSLQEPIGIGYVEKIYSEIGTKISVDIRGKERQAEVVETPFLRKI